MGFENFILTPILPIHATPVTIEKKKIIITNLQKGIKTRIIAYFEQQLARRLLMEIPYNDTIRASKETKN